MKKLISVILGVALLATSALPALASFPWGSTGPVNTSGATPTITYTSTALAAIEDMTANVTSITLAGMTAGTYYTLVLMQDGTGSRTLTQTAITGAPALTTAESAANGYAVWIIKATSASAASFVADYSNAPLWDSFAQAVTTNTGQAVANVASAQAAPTIVVPGMLATSGCNVTPQLNPTTWAGGLVLRCLPATNSAELVFVNPTAATITATATAVNVRVTP